MKHSYSGGSHKKTSKKGNEKSQTTPGNYSGTVSTRHWGGVTGSVTSKKYG